MGRTARNLTPEQEKWLIEHFEHTKNDEIMARLGICHSMLHRLAKEFGLKKSSQFMKACQQAASEAAKASHLLHGTYPPKGYIIPRSAEVRFKKGVSNKDRLSPERYRECQEKRVASWKKTREADRRRFVFGLDQRTNFRFVRQPGTKTSYRHNMKKKGYITDRERSIIYYTSETVRHPRAEGSASKYNIRILPLPENEKNNHKSSADQQEPAELGQ